MLQSMMALVVFLFPLAYSPGPGNMFFAANSARFGFAATIPANAGYHIATWVVTASIGLGFVTAMDQAPAVFAGLRIAGALYIFWIAWKMFRAAAPESETSARPASFLDGAVLLALNPKGYVIIALMFTQFLGPTGTGHVASVLLITTVFTLNNLVAFTVWALIGDRISKAFQTPGNARTLNTAFAGVLALVAVWMLAS